MSKTSMSLWKNVFMKNEFMSRLRKQEPAERRRGKTAIKINVGKSPKSRGSHLARPPHSALGPSLTSAAEFLCTLLVLIQNQYGKYE